MPASFLYRDSDVGSNAENIIPLVVKTGALALVLGQEAHPSLPAEDLPPPSVGHLPDGHLVTLYAQPTDVLGGNRVLFDDGSGPAKLVVPPPDLVGVIAAMRGHRPVSLIARMSRPDSPIDPNWWGEPALVAVYVAPGVERARDDYRISGLISIGDAQSILDRERDRKEPEPVCDAHGVAGCIECSVADPEDTMPAYRESVEWVVRPGRAGRNPHPEQRARVTTTSDVDGERVVVERLVTGRCDTAFGAIGPARDRIWVEVEDPIVRGALMAEAALRLYARQARHEKASAERRRSRIDKMVAAVAADTAARKDKEP